ncbi:hypothetical protein CDAR_405411 [Caerostris darwini]|uniref:Uncharacterized protein n=1 Tax=Caerostris darwini TaxID=1538125 RepID=A0AAV4VW68_9ARAC|nr:uncharacterized protein CDAR_542311 [Caerostris darwini]GIY81356.1 hypothetical protein CDAR_405411 [Caerostris darwini]
MAPCTKMNWFVFFLICTASFSFADTRNDVNITREIRGRSGLMGNQDSWRTYNSNNKNSKMDISLSDDSVSDSDIDDKYSFSPGGFYVPNEETMKLNYYVEEIPFDDNDQHNGFMSSEESKSAKDRNTKGMKILSELEKIETEMAERPSFWSYIKKLLVNPKFILTVAIVPIAFFAEMSVLQVLKTLGAGMLPSVTSTIASGFARSLDGDNILHVEKILDIFNKYFVRSIEDPKCLQKFLCQRARSRTEISPFVNKLVEKFEKSVDDNFLDSWGLKQFLSSVQNGNCNSLACNGSPVYTQNGSL